MATAVTPVRRNGAHKLRLPRHALSSFVLRPELAQFIFQPDRFSVLRDESNEEYGEKRDGCN